MQNVIDKLIKYSIYGLVFLLPIFFLPLSFEIYEYNKQYLLFFLVSLGVAAWLVKQIFYDKEIRFKKTPIDYFVLGFLAISILSAIFSVDQNSSIFGFYGRFSNGLIGVISFVAMYFLLTNNVSWKKPEEDEGSKYPLTVSGILNVFTYSLTVAMAFTYLAIFGILAKLSFLPLAMRQATFNAISGSLEGMSIFLASSVVLLVGILLSKAQRTIFNMILILAALGLLIIIDFLPAWIVMLAALAFLVIVSLAKRIFRDNVNRLLVPIFLIVVAIIFIAWSPIQNNLPKEQVLAQDVSWIVAIKSSTDSIKNGLIGSGEGTFHADFAKYKPRSFNQSWTWQIRFDRAGSYFSELLATKGFLGLLSFLALAGMTMIISWFLIFKNSLGIPLVMTFVALLSGYLLYYQNTSLAFLFWLVLGLLAVSWGERSALVQTKSFSFKNFPELALLFLTLAIILGVALMALYFYGVRYYLADVNYSNALSVLGEERVAYLENAVNLNPALAQYRTVLSRAYLTEALGEMQKPAGEQDAARAQLLISRAIDQTRLATDLEPNQVANWETLGVIYREIQGIAQGALDWGKKSFEEAIALEPTNPVLYTELGKLYLNSGDKIKARENFDQALVEKSDYVAATIQLALLLEQDNILEEATTRLEALVTANPFDPEARFQLGRIYFNSGRIDEAILQFQSVVILAPDHSNAHYSLGVAYASQGNTQAAISEFERVLELNPGNEDVMQKLEDLRSQ